MQKRRLISGFTLIEILVVSTIIALLMAGGIASYSQFGKQSRDARRKADLEQVRAALEMYRSNSTTSSYPISLSDLDDYIKTVPVDPKTQENYDYFPLSGGSTCPAEPCDAYLLETTLEATDGTYQTDPYGGSIVTSTPVPQPTSTTAPTSTPTPTPISCLDIAGATCCTQYCCSTLSYSGCHFGQTCCAPDNCVADPNQCPGGQY